MTVHDYIIAQLRLRSDIDLVGCGLRGFKPFQATATEGDADFHISFDCNITPPAAIETLATSYVAEADADSSFARTESGYLYTIKRRIEGATTVHFYIDSTSGRATTNIATNDGVDVSILRFGIWVLFGVVLAANEGVAIHSSAIVSDDKCAMFLGESGTGKSTHTRLWRENIEGARLLNDDSPIVRIINGTPRIFGSPWSGKTPCYKNLDYPIAGICRLSQAPHNKIRRLPTILAIGALLPSCPPLFAHDGTLQDMICDTIGKVLRTTPAYSLECLPNADAARLSHKTIILNE